LLLRCTDLSSPFSDLTCGNPAGAGPVANTRDATYRVDACELLRKERVDRDLMWNPQTEVTSGRRTDRT
jgi:hypothetical protein